jgi:hypothetical protein
MLARIQQASSFCCPLIQSLAVQRGLFWKVITGYSQGRLAKSIMMIVAYTSTCFLCYATINLSLPSIGSNRYFPANQRCSTKHNCYAQGEWDPYAGFETGLCSLVYGTAEAVESGTPAAAASATSGPDAKKKD